MQKAPTRQDNAKDRRGVYQHTFSSSLSDTLAMCVYIYRERYRKSRRSTAFIYSGRAFVARVCLPYSLALVEYFHCNSPSFRREAQHCNGTFASPSITQRGDINYKTLKSLHLSQVSSTHFSKLRKLMPSKLPGLGRIDIEVLGRIEVLTLFFRQPLHSFLPHFTKTVFKTCHSAA